MQRSGKLECSRAMAVLQDVGGWAWGLFARMVLLAVRMHVFRCSSRQICRAAELCGTNAKIAIRQMVGSGTRVFNHSKYGCQHTSPSHASANTIITPLVSNLPPTPPPHSISTARQLVKPPTILKLRCLPVTGSRPVHHAMCHNSVDQLFCYCYYNTLQHMRTGLSPDDARCVVESLVVGGCTSVTLEQVQAWCVAEAWNRVKCAITRATVATEYCALTGWGHVSGVRCGAWLARLGCGWRTMAVHACGAVHACLLSHAFLYKHGQAAWTSLWHAPCKVLIRASNRCNSQPQMALPR